MVGEKAYLAPHLGKLIVEIATDNDERLWLEAKALFDLANGSDAPLPELAESAFYAVLVLAGKEDEIASAAFDAATQFAHTSITSLKASPQGPAYAYFIKAGRETLAKTSENVREQETDALEETALGEALRQAWPPPLFLAPRRRAWPHGAGAKNHPVPCPAAATRQPS